jgi:hypothetical protein
MGLKQACVYDRFRLLFNLHFRSHKFRLAKVTGEPMPFFIDGGPHPVNNGPVPLWLLMLSLYASTMAQWQDELLCCCCCCCNGRQGADDRLLLLCHRGRFQIVFGQPKKYFFRPTIPLPNPPPAYSNNVFLTSLQQERQCI